METENVQDTEQPNIEDLGQSDDFKTEYIDEFPAKEERTNEMKESPEMMEKRSPNDSRKYYVFLNENNQLKFEKKEVSPNDWSPQAYHPSQGFCMKLPLMSPIRTTIVSNKDF